MTTEEKQRLIELCAGAIELAHTDKRDAEMVDVVLTVLQALKENTLLPHSTLVEFRYLEDVKRVLRSLQREIQALTKENGRLSALVPKQASGARDQVLQSSHEQDELREQAGIGATIAILERFKAHVLSPEERKAHFHYFRIPERYRDLPDKYEASKAALDIADDIRRASHDSLPTVVLVDFTEVYPEDTFADFKMKCAHDGGRARVHIKSALDSLPRRINVFVLFCPGAHQFSKWR